MAKVRLSGSFSHLLYTLGDALRFAPSSAFAPACSEKERGERTKPLLAYRLKIKTALARMCEQSFFLSLCSSLIRGFFNTRIRSFGVLFFSCGFLQILSYFMGVYLPLAAGDENNLIHGVTLIFLTLLCSFTRGDVKDVLKKSFLYRSVLSPLFGSDGWQFPNERSGDNFLAMILTGALLAFFSVVFSPLAVLSVILLLVLVLFVFYQPEAGLVSVALTFFAVSFEVTVFLILLTLVSFLFKCAIGKRTLVFSATDSAVLLCMLLLLFSAQSKGLCFLLIALYLLAMGLLRTLASVRRLMCAMMLGGVFCSVMILARYVLTTFFEEVLFRFPSLDTFLFIEPETSTVAIVAMVCPVAAGFFRSLKTRARLFFAPLIFLLFLGAIFCGASPQVWIALLIALAVQNLMTYRYTLVLYVMVGLSLISALNVIPQKLLLQFLAYFGYSQTEAAPSAPVPIAQSLMLAGLLCFFIWAVIRFAASATRPEAFPRVLGAIAGMVAFFSMWMGGVLTDERILILFVMLLAFPRVCLICSRREEIRLPY